MRFALATHHGTGLCGVQKRLLTTALLSALAGDAMSLGTHYEYDAHKVELTAAFPSLEPPSQPCARALPLSCLIPISLDDIEVDTGPYSDYHYPHYGSQYPHHDSSYPTHDYW